MRRRQKVRRDPSKFVSIAVDDNKNFAPVKKYTPGSVPAARPLPGVGISWTLSSKDFLISADFQKHF